MIPYLVFWIFVIIGGQIADFLITREVLTIEWTRKLCCALGKFYLCSQWPVISSSFTSPYVPDTRVYGLF